MSTLQVSKLESLILEKLCTLSYVAGVGYSDDGQEVTILVVHDNVGDRDAEIVYEISRRGTEIEHEIPDRMISPLPVFDTPGQTKDAISDSKVIYVRDARQ